MKKIKVKNGCGYKVYNDANRFLGYMPSFSGEGKIYKDNDAFEQFHDAICYIPEHGFDDFAEQGYIPEKFVRSESAGGETRNTIREKIHWRYSLGYNITDQQADYLAQQVFGMAEWAYVSSMIEENELIEDAIALDTEHKVFTADQYDALGNGMSPRDWANKQESEKDNAEMLKDEELADLKAKLFRKFGTQEIKVNMKLGKQDWASGSTPYCTAIRAISETSFEWYLEDWAYGWYPCEIGNHCQTKWHFGIDKQKKLLRRVLGMKASVTIPIEVANNIIKYCEKQAIYDKLSSYGDFYYKLKQLVGDEEEEE